MHEKKTWGRREFTVASALAALSGVAITVSGCGGGSSSSGGSPTTPSTPAPTPEPGGDVTGTISANHGHTAVISAARLAEPEMVELDITGSANHPHTLTLTDGEVQQIADGQTVAKVSSSDQGHAHTVTFN